jgi:hypothetical protein
MGTETEKLAEENQLIKDMWSVLKDKLTLPEKMKIFGASERDIAETSKLIEDGRMNSFHMFSLSSFYTKKAYHLLADCKEIDRTKMFNLITKSYDNESERKRGDVGYINNNEYIFVQNKWMYTI